MATANDTRIPTILTDVTLDASGLLSVFGGRDGPIVVQLDPGTGYDGENPWVFSDVAGGSNVILNTPPQFSPIAPVSAIEGQLTKVPGLLLFDSVASSQSTVSAELSVVSGILYSAPSSSALVSGIGTSHLTLTGSLDAVNDLLANVQYVGSTSTTNDVLKASASDTEGGRSESSQGITIVKPSRDSRMEDLFYGKYEATIDVPGLTVSYNSRYSGIEIITYSHIYGDIFFTWEYGRIAQDDIRGIYCQYTADIKTNNNNSFHLYSMNNIYGSQPTTAITTSSGIELTSGLASERWSIDIPDIYILQYSSLNFGFNFDPQSRNYPDGNYPVYYNFIGLDDGEGDLQQRQIVSTPGQISVHPIFPSIINDGAGSQFAVQFGSVAESVNPNAATAEISADVQSGYTRVWNGVGTTPSLASGQTGAILTSSGSTFTLPSGCSVFATNSPYRSTVSGGTSKDQTIICGDGGLAFNAGSGAGSVFAASGANLVSVYPGGGAQFIQTGAGNDTVVVLSADDTVNAGGGTNLILTGTGNQVINSTGDDLIAAGAIGSATINAGANNPVAFFGPGRTVFNGGTGHATLVSGTGSSTVNAVGGSQIWLGSGQDVVNSTGTDTIIGGAGAASVNATAGNSMLFAGIGSLTYRGGSGSSTILGSTSGSATVQGGSGSLLALNYADMEFTGGSGSATVAAFGGSVTINGAGGGGVFLGGPAGNNAMTAGSGLSVILGGGDGDVLSASTIPGAAGAAILGGAGAETITGFGSTAVNHFYGGSGPNIIRAGDFSTSIQVGTGVTTLIGGTGVALFAFPMGNANAVEVQGFNPALDYISFPGFGPGEAAAALAGAVVGGGAEVLTLSDGTHITFQGFTALSASNFL